MCSVLCYDILFLQHPVWSELLTRSLICFHYVCVCVQFQSSMAFSSILLYVYRVYNMCVIGVERHESRAREHSPVVAGSFHLYYLASKIGTSFVRSFLPRDGCRSRVSNSRISQATYTHTHERREGTTRAGSGCLPPMDACYLLWME